MAFENCRGLIHGSEDDDVAGEEENLRHGLKEALTRFMKIAAAFKWPSHLKKLRINQ